MFKKLKDKLKKIWDSIFKKSEPLKEPQDASDISDASATEVIIVDAPDAGFDEDIFDIAQPHAKQRYLWCLDNGHGKLTAGKRSPVFDDGTTQFFEYEFNRAIVKLIIKQLAVLGVRYFEVVPEVEVGDILEERVKRANEKTDPLPKIFVSIHSNAAPAASPNDWCAPNIRGIETWHYHNSVKGEKIATIFQRHLIQKTGFVNRHLKSRPEGQFYVLRETKMPAILTENGFYNNKEEAAELMKKEVRQKIADAHVAAILEIEKKDF